MYLKFDRERAYAPRVPIVSEVITTKKQTKEVFIKAFQNSSLTPAPWYPIKVKGEP